MSEEDRTKGQPPRGEGEERVPEIKDQKEALSLLERIIRRLRRKRSQLAAPLAKDVETKLDKLLQEAQVKARTLKFVRTEDARGNAIKQFREALAGVAETEKQIDELPKKEAKKNTPDVRKKKERPQKKRNDRPGSGQQEWGKLEMPRQKRDEIVPEEVPEEVVPVAEETSPEQAPVEKESKDEPEVEKEEIEKTPEKKLGAVELFALYEDLLGKLEKEERRVLGEEDLKRIIGKDGEKYVTQIENLLWSKKVIKGMAGKPGTRPTARPKFVFYPQRVKSAHNAAEAQARKLESPEAREELDTWINRNLEKGFQLIGDKRRNVAGKEIVVNKYFIQLTKNRFLPLAKLLELMEENPEDLPRAWRLPQRLTKKGISHHHVREQLMASPVFPDSFALRESFRIGEPGDWRRRPEEKETTLEEFLEEEGMGDLFVPEEETEEEVQKEKPAREKRDFDPKLFDQAVGEYKQMLEDVRSEKSVTNEHLDLLRNRWRDNIIRLLVSVKKDENNQHDAYQGLHELFEIIKQDSQKEVGVLGEEYEKQVVKQPEPEVRLKAASKKEVAQEEMAEDVEFDPEAVTNMLTAAMTVKAYLIDHPQVRTDEIRAHLGKILEETGVVLTDEQWEQMSKYIPKQAEEISKKEKKGVVYSSVRETEFEVKKEKEADDLEGPKVPKEVIESGRYEGNTNKEGMPDGVGTISYPDSPEIEMVEAKFVGGVLPEEGKIVYTDGSYYEGDIRFLENNVDHPRRWGQGTWFDEDGEELDVGRWRNDELLEVAEPTFDERFEKKDQAGIVERAKEIFANLPDPFKEVAAGDTDFDFGKKEAAMKPRIDELQAELLRAYGTESSKELEETLQQIIDHLLENNQVIAAKLVKVNLSAGRSINLELKPELLIQARDHLAEAGQTTDPSADQYKHGMTDYRRATMLLGKYVEEEKSEAGGEEKGEEKDKSNYISDIRSEVEQFLASDPLPPRWKLKVSVVLDEAKKQGIEISPEDLQPLKLLFQNVYEAFLRTTEDGIVDKTGLDKDITKWLGKEPELNEDSHKELDRMRTRELSAPGSPLPTIEWIEEYAEKKGKPLEKIDIVTAQATFDRLVGTGETEWMKAFENFVERRVDGSLSFNEAVFKDAFYKATGDGEDVSYSAKLSSLVFYAIEKKVFPFVDIDSALNKATTTYVAEIADKVFKGELSLEQIKKGER